MAKSTDKSARIKADKPLSASHDFEGLKQTNEHGAEYWSARDLQSVLGYSQWRRFEEAVQRAITSCEQSGNNPQNHFAGVGKMVELGSGSAREVEDFHLSRFACYLIAQNGDPRKPEIAHAQKYFAVRNSPTGWRRIWSEWICANKHRRNSRPYQAPHSKPASRTKCSAYSTTQGTKGYTAVWVAKPSRQEKIFLPNSS